MPRAVALRIAGIAALALALWIGVGMFDAQRACAHDPRFACSPRDAAHPVRIGDPQKSWAFYGRLAPMQRDTYAFDARRPLRVPWNLLIERRDAGKAGRPTAQIFSANGTKVAERTISAGAAPFYEPFSGIHYLSSADTPIALPPGAYRIVVSMSGEPPGDGAQRYVLAIGEDERFTLGEIPYVLGAVLRVRTRGY